MVSEGDQRLVMFEVRSNEIQWRGIQRDFWALIGLGVCGSMFSLDVWALAAPVVLLFIGNLWFTHDRRIGSGARYLRDIVEPKLTEVEGYEHYLNNIEKSRKHGRRFYIDSVVARLYFPVLQIGMITRGVYSYVNSHHYVVGTNLVTAAVVFDVVIVIVTFARVRHIRIAKVA